MFDDPDDATTAQWADASPNDDATAALLARTRDPGTHEELVAQTTVVSMMASVIAAPSTNVSAMAPSAERRRLRATKALTKLAVVAAGVVVGTSAAAATGHLPDGAQSALARVTAHLGIHLTDPNLAVPSTIPPASTGPLPVAVNNDQASTGDPVEPEAEAIPQPAVTSTLAASTPAGSAITVATPDSLHVPTSEPTSTTAPRGPDADGSAKHGLCNAWRAHQSNGTAVDSVAMRNLEATAAAAGETVEAFCDDPATPAPTDAETATTADARHAQPKPTKPDKPRQSDTVGEKNGKGVSPTSSDLTSGTTDHKANEKRKGK